MDKYINALNTITNYEVWHECTYDDGYSNFDDWTEYPFGDSEEVNLLSELITKHDTLNKGIDELITEYENASKNFVNKILVDEIITDLKKLKGE